MAIKTFNRYEYKYIISKAQYYQMYDYLKQHKEIKLDQFCEANSQYHIYNIYIDTKDKSLIRHSISKPKYKHKLRLRCYAKPSSDNDPVYFEIKKKYMGLVNKRRCDMTYKEAKDFIKHNIIPSDNKYINKQVINEIKYILSKDSYELSSHISYDRVAFFSLDDKLRISFDFNVQSDKNQILDDEYYLMEVKTLDSIPIWLVNQLDDLNIKKQSFSKYGRDFLTNIKEKNYDYTNITI